MNTLSSPLMHWAARYMGAPRPDERTLALIKRGFAIVNESAQPRHRLLRLPTAAFPLPGRDAPALIADCPEMLLIAATLGAEMDARIRRESLMDMALGLAVNACAAAYLEDYLNRLPLPLTEGEYPTPRFSPGYGDLPLSLQTAFLRKLEAHRIGLFETDAHMLVPEKSVTALCGVTHAPQAQCLRACDRCSKTDCPFREG